MKKKNLFGGAVVAIALTASIIAGCKKSEDSASAIQPDSETMYDNSVADASFDDAGNVADEGVTGNLSSYRIADGEGVQTTCAHVTLDLISNPKTAIIDFGNSDCLCKDGNYRKGKILVSWSGNYSDEGSSHTITFDNYFLNFNQVTGSKTVTNWGRNPDGKLTFNIIVNGSIIVSAQYSQTGASGTITYSANRTRIWKEGEATPLNWLDDVYLISGTSQGTSIKGTNWTASIDGSNLLRKEIGFPHFTRGIVNLSSTPQGGTTTSAVIDYSYLDGNRDNLARITSNGITYTIRLGMK